MAKKILYGLGWHEHMEPLAIEMEMCRHNGQVKRKDGQVVGNGMVWHWKRAQSLIWPDHPDSPARKKWHRWNELQAECYVKYRTIVVLGPASSGKTNSAATDALFDYYLYPSCTSVIICSTTRERLEDRVWGEIKKYHKAAKELYPWLPGNLIEGRLRLVTDARSQSEEGRDFRNGVIGVACFSSGTMVDTPAGQVPIERIRVGQQVFSSNGIGAVTETHSRTASLLLRVTLCDGRIIDCTPEHPFFTLRGWVAAVDLQTSDMVFSAHEGLQIMRRGHQLQIPEQQVLPSVQHVSPRETLCVLRNSVSTHTGIQKSYTGDGEVLREGLRWSLGYRKSLAKARKEEVQTLRQVDERSALQSGILFCSVPQSATDDALSMLRKGIHVHPGKSQKATGAILQQILQDERDGEAATKERHRTYAGGVNCLEVISASGLESSFQNWIAAEGWTFSLVQNRLGFPGDQIGSRDRRRGASHSSRDREGHSEDENIGGTRVDRVEVLEPRGDPRYSESEGGYRVYNLEVSGHPSYSVNGVVVHNCKRGENFVGIGDFAGIKNKRVRLIGDELSLLPRAFVDAISNLDKNEDFKCEGLGNPKEPTDALGILGEPAAEIGGWDSGIDQTPGTKTWPIRRPEGICIQLVGSDSPNLDGKLGIPIITQEQIDRDVAFYGKDSVWFTMMNEGRMPRGTGSHRVLTRQMCLKFHALEQPVWRDTNIKKIAFMDAGYGGDRCIFGELNFGRPSEAEFTETAQVGALASHDAPLVYGRQIAAIVDTMVVPIANEKGSDLPEDQIVHWVVAQLEKRGIPLSDFFYEPGQRTKLTVAFSRITGGIGNPIDFGGKATERPVAHGMDVLCVDYYSKFVTEAWYSFRLAVEAGQIRGLTEGAMWEFCAREWGYVGGNRIEVEPKPKMKEKTGRSPDEADAIVTGLEGARQRGFQIVKVGSAAVPKQRTSEAWKRRIADSSRKVWHSGDLDYAA